MCAKASRSRPYASAQAACRRASTSGPGPVEARLDSRFELVEQIARRARDRQASHHRRRHVQRDPAPHPVVRDVAVEQRAQHALVGPREFPTPAEHRVHAHGSRRQDRRDQRRPVRARGYFAICQSWFVDDARAPAQALSHPRSAGASGSQIEPDTKRFEVFAFHDDEIRPSWTIDEAVAIVRRVELAAEGDAPAGGITESFVLRGEPLDENEVPCGRQIRKCQLIARETAQQRRRQQDREAIASLRLEPESLVDGLEAETTADPRRYGHRAPR